MKLSLARLAISAVLVSVFGADTHAQQLPSVVQLPSFQVFSYSGSVLVPDSGAAYLGGNNVSSSSYRRRGFRRSFGFANSNAHAAVRAQIIDQNDIDRQLLGGTKQQFLDSDRGKPLAGATDNVGRPRAISPTEEGKALVRHARKQYRAGSRAASFETYQLAIGILDGRLEELAKVEFRRVFGPAADQALGMSRLRR